MTQTTIGQRISGRRKLQNLSQEALAQQLQVSRQAVSKWEADSAIPEIDKLIALSRIFGVSVGWLLGTESESELAFSESLSDAQLQALEQLLARYQSVPRRMRCISCLLALCVLVAAVIFCIRSQNRIDTLTAENANTLKRIAAMAEDNRKLQIQIDSMNALLEEQAQEGKLLSWIQILPAIKDDMKTVKLQFYCAPKVLPENTSAYIVLTNPALSVEQRLACHPMGQLLFVQTEVPLADGYRYSFLLVSDSGFQEQIISGEGTPLGYCQDFDTGLHFYVDPKAEARTQWSAGDQQYRFDLPVYTPLLLPDNAKVGYEDVLLTLKLDGQILWESSCRDSLRDHAGAYMLSEDPWYPAVKVALPALQQGDTLELSVTACYYGGQTITSVLETLNVT